MQHRFAAIGGRAAAGDGLRYGVAESRLVDEAGLDHAAQHITLAQRRARRIDDRVEGRWRLGQPCQHRRLGQRDLAERFAEVGLCGHREAVGALAEIDLVEVKLEDLVLRQAALDLQREQDFIELAIEGLLARQEEVSRHLHGDRRGALAASARGHVGDCRAHDAKRVDAGMFVEALVLGREDGLLEDGRHVGDVHHAAAFLAEFAQQVAVGSEHPQRHTRAIVGEGFERRQVGPREQRDGDQRGDAEDRERDQRRNRIEDPAHWQSTRKIGSLV